jgi:uncharacterized protein (DUF1778 family)
MSKKMGRPKKLLARKLNRFITLRVTADELKAIDAAAKADGKNRSDWARKILTRAASVIQ